MAPEKRRLPYPARLSYASVTFSRLSISSCRETFFSAGFAISSTKSITLSSKIGALSSCSAPGVFSKYS